jgi:hypothetical protein
MLAFPLYCAILPDVYKPVRVKNSIFRAGMALAMPGNDDVTPNIQKSV